MIIQPPTQIRSEPLLQTQKKPYEDDSFETFGRFMASELRSIADPTDAHRIQRKLQRLLIDAMDELDAVTSGSKPQEEMSAKKTFKSDKVTFLVI